MSSKLSQIIIPILTCAVGVLGTAWWSSQSLDVQELALAYQILLSENRAKVEGAEAWALQRVNKYKAETKRDEQQPAAQPTMPQQEPPIVVWPKDPENRICIFPKDAFFPKPHFVIDREKDKLTGQDARLILLKAVNDYRQLESSYDTVVGILRKTCGFLNPPAEESDDIQPK